MTYSEKQLLQKLRSDKYPNVAEDGKGFFILWADGRAQVGYKNKKHAIDFIEQGDRDAVSMQYRDREKGERVRNLFSPDKSSIHDFLFEEASAKREHRKKAIVHELLFAEADERLQKESMATQSMEVNEDQGETDLIEPSTPETPVPAPVSMPDVQVPVGAPTTWTENLDDSSQWTLDFEPSPTELEESVRPRPTVPEQMPKPMYDPSLDYIGKDKKKRRLIKQRPMGIASIKEKLQKAANKLDQYGESAVADKIDLLLTRLDETDNVRKTSRI